MTTGKVQIESDDGIGLTLGAYRLGQVIGSGAHARVFAATLSSDGLGVEPSWAIKWARRADRLAQRRFDREIRIGTALRHPGLVRVADHGVEDGRPWFAMPLYGRVTLRGILEGNTLGHPNDIPGLARAVESDRLPPVDFSQRRLLPKTAALTLLVELARTLAYAHDRGVIHRDLKPENVLIGTNGQAVVADFGLGVDVHERVRLTLTGEIMGTLAYMAPEMLKGDASKVDGRCDVFSLGQILVELLTGRPLAVVGGRVRWRREESIDRPLRRILEGALAARPVERYPTAWALAVDVERLLQGAAVQGVPLGFVDRCGRSVRRYPGRFSAVAGILLVALVFSVTSHWLAMAEASRWQEPLRDLQLGDRAQVGRLAEGLEGWVLGRQGLSALGAEQALFKDSRILPGSAQVFVAVDDPGDRQWSLIMGRRDGDDTGYELRVDPLRQRLVLLRDGIPVRARFFNDQASSWTLGQHDSRVTILADGAEVLSFLEVLPLPGGEPLFIIGQGNGRGPEFMTWMTRARTLPQRLGVTQALAQVVVEAEGRDPATALALLKPLAPSLLDQALGEGWDLADSLAIRGLLILQQVEGPSEDSTRRLTHVLGGGSPLSGVGWVLDSVDYRLAQEDPGDLGGLSELLLTLFEESRSDREHIRSWIMNRTIRYPGRYGALAQRVLALALADGDDHPEWDLLLEQEGIGKALVN